MLGLIGAYVAYRIVWRLLRGLMLVAVVVAVLVVASHRHANVGRLGDPGYWRSQAKAVQRDVQRAVQHGLQPVPAVRRSRR